MRVLHVIPSVSAVHGGPTRALEMMEAALAAQGVEVETATTDDDGRGRFAARPLGVPVAQGPATRWYFRKRTEFYKTAPSFVPWASRNLHRFDAVHVHALFSFMSTAACLLARRHGVPCIVRPLGTLGTYGMSQRRRHVKALSLALIEGPLLRHARAVHFTDERELREAQALGIAMHPAVIPLAVDLPLVEPHVRSAGSPCELLFLSRLDPKKNLEALIGAMALLADAAPGFRLRVAGSGDPAYVRTLHDLAATLGVSQHIRWLGHVSGDDKARAFAGADIFVLPSFSENFGIAAAEALAFGVPCLLAEGVALAQPVRASNAGRVVAPDAQAIADALRRMIADDGELRTMASNARRLAETQYAPALMGARLKSLYAEVLSP